MKEVNLSSTWGSVVLLLICLVAVNVTAFFIPLRFDLTEERLYTISDGSRKILENLKDPVRINFYYSRNNAELPPNFKTYALRVEELLEEYETLSNGKILLEILTLSLTPKKKNGLRNTGSNLLRCHPVMQYILVQLYQCLTRKCCCRILT